MMLPLLITVPQAVRAGLVPVPTRSAAAVGVVDWGVMVEVLQIWAGPEVAVSTEMAATRRPAQAPAVQASTATVETRPALAVRAAVASMVTAETRPIPEALAVEGSMAMAATLRKAAVAVVVEGRTTMVATTIHHSGQTAVARMPVLAEMYLETAETTLVGAAVTTAASWAETVARTVVVVVPDCEGIRLRGGVRFPVVLAVRMAAAAAAATGETRQDLVATADEMVVEVGLAGRTTAILKEATEASTVVAEDSERGPMWGIARATAGLLVVGAVPVAAHSWGILVETAASVPVLAAAADQTLRLPAMVATADMVPELVELA